MNIIAYTYDADYHCIACTTQMLLDALLWEGFPCSVHPLFSTDEWQELDDSFLAENPTQYLACVDCHVIIDEYTVIESEV